MTRKTDEQIAAEVAVLKALKECLPRFTLFDDDNHAAIDAQCAVLTKRMSHHEVYEAFGNEDHEDFAQHTLDAALGARHLDVRAARRERRKPQRGLVRHRGGDMSKTAALPSKSAATGMFTSLLSHCVECGCNDMNACFDEAAGDACHWLEVDRKAHKGVCSACPGAMTRWRRGQRVFAVPVDLDDG